MKYLLSKLLFTRYLPACSVMPDLISEGTPIDVLERGNTMTLYSRFGLRLLIVTAYTLGFTTEETNKKTIW